MLFPQTFSHISKKLKKENATTLIDLERIIRDSYQPTPKVENVEYIYDIKAWLREYIRDLTHHTEPHAYKFEQIEDEVVVSFKRFAMDSDWKSMQSVLSHMPDGNPTIVRPTWKAQCPIEEIRSKLKTLQVTFGNSEMNWWKNFVTELETKQRLV